MKYLFDRIKSVEELEKPIYIKATRQLQIGLRKRAIELMNQEIEKYENEIEELEDMIEWN